ncbi:chloride channel protein [Pedobacter psychroterrae]|uniref:Chloride channel protein n=1 Tax=Pedobacter psychroterrae TaxID=2530453 RepID=A0A4R0NCD5_9SPHI|nr:chloride channel protein [Pedobacter psychroterrae]TCC97990.1 chloride channel protein [Pedobacter psychroterrae]
MQNLNTYFFTLFKWIVLLLLTGIAAGTLSALFLESLNWVTDYREAHKWLIYLLPLGGLIIGLAYHYKGVSVVRGNNLVFDTVHNPKDVIPFRMVPLVLAGTLVTHLFGGSAGREGTALQMSAAAADQLHKPFKLTSEERTILLKAGLSAGFASVFGTPLAGAIFGIEVLLINKFPYKAVVPAVIAAYLAAYVTGLWGVGHTHYHIDVVPKVSFMGLGSSTLAGVLFGIAAILFVRTTEQVSGLAKKIKYPPLRPVVGGILILVLVLLLDTHKYIGLGIPVILDAFTVPAAPQDFMIKILLTAITLGMGFKGGEVTPLFFIGAVLGSALAAVLPLPVGLLAGMGFVAVFAGAAKTPLACMVMGAELFGISGCLYITVACIVAYFISGKHSIYNAPENKAPGHFLFNFKLNK